MPARPAKPSRQAHTNKKAPGRKPAASKKAPAKTAPTPKAKPAKKPPGKKASAPQPKPAKKPSGKKASAPQPKPAKKPPGKQAPTPQAKASNQARVKKAPQPKPVKKAAAPVKKARPKATPARDALQALALKRTISQALAPLPNDRTAVDAYFRDIDHPFKAEMEAVRAIVLGVSDKISERIKWNAPSFFYKDDLGAFNPRATEYAHLILLFPGGLGMDDSKGLLEGNHKDRREAKFHSLDDVNAKKRALEKLVKNWLTLRDR